MLARTESGVEPRPDLARRPLARKHPASQRRAPSLPQTRPAPRVFGRPAVHDRLRSLPLRPLIAQYTATFGSTWAPVTRRKHRDDFARLVDWLEARRLPVTTESLDFMTLVDYVTDLRSRPKVTGVWRGSPDAIGRSLRAGSTEKLSANS